MILFFDTETSGFPDYQMPPSHDCQPALVQLACLLADEDGTERAMCSMLVEPIGKTIPENAAKVHGITTDLAIRCGVYPTGALYFWDRFAQMADLIVAHNVKFDRAILKCAWAHHNPARRATPSEFDLRHPAGKWYCTMEAAAPIVNLPPTDRMKAAGFNKPKAPKLEECIKHFFAEELSGAHDALVDVRACARVYFHLKSLQGSTEHG